jgi:hypothetical protein
MCEKFTRCLLPLLLLLPLSSTAAIGAGIGDDATLWRDSSYTSARFVPQETLEAIDVSADGVAGLSLLPLSEAERSRLAYHLDRARTRGACERPPVIDTFAAPPAPGSLSFADLARRADVSLVGRVVDTVPGWFTDWSRAATLVVVQVEEVLSGHADGARPGSRLTYLQLAGNVTVGDVELCLDDSGLHWAAVGERLLVNGIVDVQNPGNLFATQVFVVDGEAVQPNDYYTALADTSPRLLSDLRRELTGEGR